MGPVERLAEFARNVHYKVNKDFRVKVLQGPKFTRRASMKLSALEKGHIRIVKDESV